MIKKLNLLYALDTISTIRLFSILALYLIYTVWGLSGYLMAYALMNIVIYVAFIFFIRRWINSTVALTYCLIALFFIFITIMAYFFTL